MIYFKGTINDAKRFRFRKINHKEEQDWRSYCYMTTCPAPLTAEQRKDEEFRRDYCRRKSSFLTIYEDGEINVNLSGGNLENYGEQLLIELYNEGLIEFVKWDDWGKFEETVVPMRKRR